MFLKKNNRIKTIVVAVLCAFIINFINIPVFATEIDETDVTISISKDKVKSNETIEVTLKNGSKDGWVGLYSEDLEIGNNPSIWWKYVNELGNKDGNGTFNLDLTGIVEAGKYKLVLFKDSKYIIEAEVEFEVEVVEVPEGIGHLELKTSVGVAPTLPEKIEVASEEIAVKWDENDEHIYRSEGWLLDVYEDKIVLKGRDFTNDIWVEEAQYTVNYPEDMPENDLEKPTWDASAKLNAKEVAAFDVVLNWDKDSVKDNVGVTKFNIYKNEELVATVDSDTNEFKVEGLEENTEYKFTIQAIDGLENITVDGPSVTVKTEKYLLKKIDQSLMSATATSEESKLANNKAVNVLDGNLDTIWHSAFNNTNNPLPQSITLEFDNVYNVGALKYTPRKSGTNGIISKYKVYTSIDGTEYTEVATGEWTVNNKEKLVEF